MKKMKIKYIALMAISLLFVFNSCDLDQQEDPNNLTADQVEVDLMLNALQINYELVFNDINLADLELSRQISQFGAYVGTFSNLTATSVDRLWRTAYLEIFNNGSDILEQLDGSTGYDYHLGMTKALMAMTLVNLVDHFGDIPWTEAIQGAGNFHPSVDDDAALYTQAFTYLDEALVHFTTPQGIPNDFFYGGSASSWIDFINTFKIKMYMNMSVIDAAGAQSAINAIIATGNYITSAAGDFQWNYSVNAANPDARHREFRNNYLPGGANDYIANWLLNAMYNEKASVDPRMRYYFYRQTDVAPSGDNLPCDGLGFDYCYVGGLYWGRDHGDDEGVPPDGEDRTTWGVYPAGGQFDNDQLTTGTTESGLRGGGIIPIMLYAYTEFILAEAVLELGVTGTGKTARQHFEDGIRASMAKVENFGASLATGTGNEMTAAAVDAYVLEALANYDGAADPLDIIMKEYFIALFGNGLEAYNALKRTGYPSDIQDPVRESGAFPRTFQYPAQAVQRNENITQRLVTETVFWDDGTTTLN